MLTFREATLLHKEYDAIPLTVTIPSDLETPLSCYLKWAAKYPVNFLFESVEGGESIARYSFIGADPIEDWTFSPSSISHRSGKQKQNLNRGPLEVIRQSSHIGKVYQPESLPGFLGGLIGYFGYETAGWTERLPRFENSLGWPDAWLGRFEKLIIFDHRHQVMTLVVLLRHPTKARGFADVYEKGSDTLAAMAAALVKPLPASARAVTSAQSGTKMKSPQVREEMTKEQFAKMVKQAKKHIVQGDIFQVVLSRRWSVKSSRSPIDVYRSLRRQNPSPYLFLLQMNTRSIVGSSPEMLLRATNGELETRPIAGTRPRGKNSAHDLFLETDLRADQKELAEHTMLVDLGRNDLGRVSEPGSITIPDNLIVERYAHVMHLVSSVRGRLRKGKDALEAHQAVFPAGTVSGAPKIRAMEIIADIEKEGRGVYAGSIGYLDYHGNLDTCIAIRTACHEKGVYHVRAGAGIVADSVAINEFHETAHKAASMIRAITEDDVC